MRDKLIGLIKSGGVIIPETAEAVADHLIANNVILFPDKLKDSWELTSSFVLRLFCSNEEELDKMKREFECQKVKQILTDIRDYLVAKAELVRERDMEWLGQSAMLNLIAIEHKELKEYAEKLGVEL